MSEGPLEGRHFNVVTVDHFPYMVLERHGAAWIGLQGIDYQITRHLAEHFKFSYDLIVPPDNTWGCFVAGNWSGVVGMLWRQQADFAVAFLAIMEDRFRDVDFSGPYHVDAVSFLTGKPPPYFTGISTVTTFSPGTWILIGVSALTVYLMLVVMHPKQKRRWQLAALTFFGEKGSREGSRLPVRLLQGTWWMTFFLILCAFNCIITSRLNVPFPVDNVDTVEKLVEKVAKGQYQVGALNTTDMFRYMRDDNDGVYHALGVRLRKDPSRYALSDLGSGLERSLTQSFAVVSVLGILRPATRTLGGERRFVLPKNDISPFYICVAYPKGSPLKALFRRPILALVESGLVAFWWNDALERGPASKQNENDIEDNFNEESQSSDSQALGVVDLRSVFGAFLTGHFLATCYLIVEVLKRRVRGTLGQTMGLKVRDSTVSELYPEATVTREKTPSDEEYYQSNRRRKILS